MELLEIKKALNTGAYWLFSEARDPNKWEKIKTSHYYREVLSEIEAGAKKFLDRPIKALPYSLFKLFHETGSRKEYVNQTEEFI